MGYRHEMDGWGWATGMMLFWVVIAALAVGAVILLLRRERRPAAVGPTALDELDLRLARGEIDVDDYTRRRDAIRQRAE